MAVQNGKEENRVPEEERCYDCNCLEGEITLTLFTDSEIKAVG